MAVVDTPRSGSDDRQRILHLEESAPDRKSVV